MLVSGSRGKSQTLVNLLESDLTGSKSFLYWIVAILILGGIGYVQDLKTISRAFLVLVIVALILNEDKNGNDFFTGFQKAIGQSTTGN